MPRWKSQKSCLKAVFTSKNNNSENKSYGKLNLRHEIGSGCHKFNISKFDLERLQNIFRLLVQFAELRFEKGSEIAETLAGENY